VTILRLLFHRFAGSPAAVRGEGTSVDSMDEPGEEMSELSRVWRIYVDEATKFDTSLAEGCNRDMDVLLVFVSALLVINLAIMM
jgi:Family of unknown function (DUF6535)